MGKSEEGARTVNGRSGHSNRWRALPCMPRLATDGTYPAAEAMRVLTARKIIAAREAVGLSEAELARKAGIRVETLNRLQKGKHTPDLATMAKINKALDNAGAS